MYLLEREREWEGESVCAGEGAKGEGEADSMQGAQRGTRSRDSRATPWAKDRHQTAEPLRDPLGLDIKNQG